METTIKVSKKTKERLLALDLSEKGKSFDMVVNDLITFYEKDRAKYKKDYVAWEKSFKKHQKAVSTSEKEDKMWERLLVWAKNQGFKG